MLARHIGKLHQELVQRIARFEIVEQRLHRHPRTREHGRSAEALRGGGDEGAREGHGGNIAFDRQKHYK